MVGRSMISLTSAVRCDKKLGENLGKIGKGHTGHGHLTWTESLTPYLNKCDIRVRLRHPPCPCSIAIGFGSVRFPLG